MELKYRWMQKKDFEYINKKTSSDSFLFLFRKKQVIANIVEKKGKIVGWVAYKLLRNKVKIVKLGYNNKETFSFIMSKINEFDIKKRSFVEIMISEYDYNSHLIFRDSGFVASNVINHKDCCYYIFRKNRKEF
jgi:IS1 family transposase